MAREEMQVYEKARTDVRIMKEKICQFFLRTSACRYGEVCNKKHISPRISTTLVFKNMLQDFSPPKYSKLHLLNAFRKKSLIELEDENEELYTDRCAEDNSHRFKLFFMDIFPEFEKFGRIKNILVCKNESVHLRGNVYVTYENLNDSNQCYQKMKGRYYAGLPLYVNFSFLENAKDAKCSYQNKCPRHMNCNFLHVYANPNMTPRKRSRSPRGKISQ